MTMRFVAFATREFPVDGWESIRDLEIGLVRGWKILEENTEGFPYVTRVATELELFNMLRLGRIDVALYSELTGRAAPASYGSQYAAIHSLSPPLVERDMFLYVHRGRADLVAVIAQALREMKNDGTYEEIVRSSLARLD